MSNQQSVTVLETPSPDAKAAQDAKEAAALKAAEGVTIQTTDRDASGNQVVTQVQEGKPAETLILGKFKTQDDLIKAYVELERKLGSGQSNQQTQQSQQDAQQQQNAQQKKEDQNDQSQVVTSEQAKAIEAAAAEYAKDRKLSDETIANLEKAGIPRAVVEQYVRGVQAEEQLIQQSVYKITGGEDGYQQMIEWAAANLPQEEIEAFDKVVFEGSIAELKAAVEGLYARFRAASGFEPGTAVKGNSGAGADAGDYFKSRHELQAAMADPRYRMGDMAFHAEVQAKLARSLQLGIQLFA